MTTTFCLDCEREIDLEASLRVGEKVICPWCDVAMEIINVDPLELDWIYDGPVTRSPLFDVWWSSTDQRNSKQGQSTSPV